MRNKQMQAAVFGILFGAATLWAQVQAPPAPWRGAGTTPCVGSDGGFYKCAPAPREVAVRAGRLFDSKSGQMLTNQEVLVSGGRITDIGPAARVRIPGVAPQPVSKHRGPFGRGRASRRARTDCTRRRLDQAVPGRRVLLHADGRGSVPGDVSITRPPGAD